LMSFNDADAISLGLVITTIGLVGATVYYSIQTKRLVQVSERSRAEQVKPVIKAFFSFVGPIYVELRIQNIGLGAAIDFEAIIDLLPKTASFPRTWKEPVLNKEMFHDFLLPEGYLEKIKSSLDEIIVKGSCKDIFGKVHSFDEKINVKEFYQIVKNAEVAIPDDYMKDIAKNAENIQKELNNIANKLDNLQPNFDSEKN
ncbi:MAG: hypothetical protein ACYCPP_07490, partial [Nitrososphaerales archaeon]